MSIESPRPLREWLAFGLALGVALFQLQAALRWQRQFIAPVARNPRIAWEPAKPVLPAYTRDTLEVVASVTSEEAELCVAAAAHLDENLIRYHAAYELLPRPIRACGEASTRPSYVMEVGVTRWSEPLNGGLLIFGTDRSREAASAFLATRLTGNRLPLVLAPSTPTAPVLREVIVERSGSGLLLGDGFEPGDRAVIDRSRVVATNFVSERTLRYVAPPGALPQEGRIGVARLPRLLPRQEITARLSDKSRATLPTRP